MGIKKTHGKYVAILIGLILIFQTVAVTSGGVMAKDNNSVSELTSDDKRIVDEISNVTGVRVEDIIKLKNEGKTWNEILEAVKKGTGYITVDDSALRDKILLQSGLGIDEVDKLTADGFSEEEIMEAKILVERIIYQLEELQQDSEITAAPVMGNEQDKNKDIARYNALLAKLELKKAVGTILKVKKNFNSIYEAMDEYMCALQLDLNIEEMLTDKRKYEDEKQEKLLTIDSLNIITVSSIETKLMDKLQAQNVNAADVMLESQNIEFDSGSEFMEKDMPQLPETEVPNVKPKDPAEELMKEINGITEISMGAEGR